MSTYDLDPGPPRLAWGMWKRFLAAMAVVFAVTVTGTATVTLLEIDDTIAQFTEAQDPIPVEAGLLDDVPAGKPQTILLLGSDRRFDDRKLGVEPRSDTIILVRLDPAQDATAIMSVPRDLKVDYRRPDGTVYADKINAAYEKGGPSATVRKVKELMQGVDGQPFPIHHVINVNFGAFTRAVKRLGCFYIDVDRRYFNDNNPPFREPTGQNYAEIDLKPGYQRLCGQDSLDFVRYRHLDTDIVRGARQQHYLGQVKNQLDLGQLFGNRDELLRIFGTYTDTDIRSQDAVLRLIKLAYDSSRNPLRRVRFRGDIGQSYVTVSPENLRRTRDEFVEVRSSNGAPGSTRRQQGRRSSPRRGGPVPGLDRAPPEVAQRVSAGASGLPFPVYAPQFLRTGTTLFDGYRNEDVMRSYEIVGPDRVAHRAYRLTLSAPGNGDFYGVQGTDWVEAPDVRDPDETVKAGGRTLLLFRDGSRLRKIAWKTDRAVYWVSNTVLRSLTNAQMLGIARSLTRVGRGG